MTNKTLEEAKAELTAISGNSYEQINTLDDLAKMVRFECVKAAEQVAKLEALHEEIFNISMQSGSAGSGSYQNASSVIDKIAQTPKSDLVVRSFK